MPPRRLPALCMALLSGAIGINAHAADETSTLRQKAQTYEHGEGVAKDSVRAVERGFMLL